MAAGAAALVLTGDSGRPNAVRPSFNVGATPSNGRGRGQRMGRLPPYGYGQGVAVPSVIPSVDVIAAAPYGDTTFCSPLGRDDVPRSSARVPSRAW